MLPEEEINLVKEVAEKVYPTIVDHIFLSNFYNAKVHESTFDYAASLAFDYAKAFAMNFKKTRNEIYDNEAKADDDNV
jgi:hypothetical protein